MVVNLSYKLTHLAQSLRPQHHFTTLRSAFPSASSPGFDFTSNVFGAAQNAATSSGTGAGSATAIGLAAGAVGAGAGASAGAGPNGGSSKAGSWGSHWGFQTGKSITQAPAAQADSNNSNDDDNLRNALSAPHRRILRPRRASISTSSPSAAFAFRMRRNTSLVPTELLQAEEAGLSSVRVRLSSTEMQRRYHSAFSQGKCTEEIAEMQQEHAEVDLGPESAQAEQVRKTGRRASMSEQPGQPQRREMHTSATTLEQEQPSKILETETPQPATPFTTEPPPTASKPATRRNSSSAAFTVPLDQSTFSKPKVTRVSEKRPRASGSTPKPSREKATAKQNNKFEFNATQQGNFGHIMAAQKSGKSEVVESAVRSYLADKANWNTRTHNLALQALNATRLPDSPLDTIITLYNQLFEHENLRPTLPSYEHVLRAFCRRDTEVRHNIAYIQKRMKKKELAADARGVWNGSSDAKDIRAEGEDALSVADEGKAHLLERERQRLAALQTSEFDYFTPALQIYRALGTLGDKLPATVVGTLLQGAVARREVDLALELFARLESSKYQSPTIRSYESLIEMYGRIEKDKDLVMEVFESFLAARADGSLALPGSGSFNLYRTTPIKHGFDTSPEYVMVDEEERAQMAISPDDRIWAATIRSLFAADDSAGAVTLLERLLVAQSASEPLPAGYPESLNARLVSNVVSGFTQSGDVEAAKRWFDRLAFPDSTKPSSAALPHFMFYQMSLYGAIETPHHELINHFYRSALDRASTDFKLIISDFFAVIDYNLARVWKAQSDDEKNAILDAIAEFRQKFEAATKQRYIAGVDGVSFGLSTGLLGRIAQVCGYHGRFEESKRAFHELANIVRRVMANASDERSGGAARTRQGWVVRINEYACGALGLKPVFSNGRYAMAGFPSALRPSLQQAVAIASWSGKFRHVVDWEPSRDQVPVVVESYLRDRDQVLGGQVRLSGDHWYTVLESFAHTQAFVKRGLKLDFEFPGFELAFEDFVKIGVKIPQGLGDYDYARFVHALKVGGVPRSTILRVIETMNEGLVEGIQADQEPMEAVQNAVASATSPVSASAESAPATATSATGASSVQGDNEPSYAPEQALPTPPATPPSYFADLAPVPQTYAFENLDRPLTRRIDSLVAANKISEALSLVHSSAQAGRFALPEAYARLVENLGRQHLVQDVRQVYLIAYSALQAMASDPEAQSLAWITLEDKMVIALAQAGELVDVGHHRDRLIQAGCAPSADGYAAMILNMKETTDDAAVALMLFEESRRYNVTPNVYLFNTLISKLSRARRAKEALEYFELMKTLGIRPSSITYGAIINACCKTGDDVAADYLFNEMTSYPDFKPRVPPYNTMIQFYTSTKPDRQRALYYYNELVKAKVPPTGHTYKLLLDAYGAIGEPDLEQMQQVFQQLVQNKRVQVTGAHWAAMINAYGTVAKDLDRAIAIFDSISHHPSIRNNPNGPLPDPVVYEALLNALLENDRPEMCEKYLDEMRSKGVRMTAYVANSLIKGYTAQNNFAAARAVFLAMQDPPVGVASLGNHAIERHPKHHHQTGTASQVSVDAPVYREPSTYEMMVKCELKAGEPRAAAEIVQMAEQRAFPPAVIARLQRLLTDVGAISLL
ncbi:Pet309p [Sporobolomyces koalae]|uniref:Pet309p n=1 Tax=Sporobolomyces koalae TaxID=500713 RepID=UPI0031740AA8